MRFLRTAQGTIDAAGYAIVTIGCPAGAIWSVGTTTVSTTSASRTTATVYLGSVTPGSMVEGTFSGNRDTSDTRYTVIGGETVTCTWTGGTPGATATLRLSGEQGEHR